MAKWVHSFDCSSNLANEELEYCLEEIIKGVCKWKPELSKDNMKTLKGTIRTKKKEK